MTALMLCILNGCCSTGCLSIRKAATEVVFNIVGVDPEMFTDDLIVDNIREMAGAGMHFGSHGSSHCWLNKETGHAVFGYNGVT